MRFTKSILSVALAASTATTAMAGGLAPVAPAPVEVVPAPAPAPSSWGIILPILGAALLIGLATSGGSDDDGEG